jgi:glycerol-3-phosphate acyltransferase PlsY
LPSGLWGGLLAVPVLLAAAFLSRHASVGSITVAVFLPLAFAVGAVRGAVPWAYEAHSLLTSALTLWALRPNIRRLLRGEERRIPK